MPGDLQNGCMAETSVPTYTLNDGTTLPAIGFGTYPLTGDDGIAAVQSALEVGYRLLDTAVNYENETEVGEALRRSGLPRDEVQVASKLPGRHHAYDDAIASVHGSLERLGLDYLDLHLIHWPNPSVGKYVEAWRALVDLKEQGLVRSIGVSNFSQDHLTRIIDATGRHALGEPGRAAPALHPAVDAPGQRGARHPHRGLEPDGQATGTARGARGDRARPSGWE